MSEFEHLADVEQGLQAIGATRFIFGVGVEAEHPSLLPIPFPDDFPGVYVFPPDVCDEAAKQISASTHTLDEAVALAIHEIAEWLTARQPGEGIVVFHY